MELNGTWAASTQTHSHHETVTRVSAFKLSGNKMATVDVDTTSAHPTYALQLQLLTLTIAIRLQSDYDPTTRYRA